ncbi:MAG: tyrosine-type recombinase/integrase, partial [Granulosicoccus sp.]
MLVAMTNRIRGYRYCYCKKQKNFVRVYTEKDGQDVPLLIDGALHAHELTQEMFDRYIDAMHKKVLADGTLRSLIGRLRTMYEWAKKQGYATSKIDFGKWNRKVGYSPMRSRKLDDDEADKILDWLKHNSKRGRHNYYRYLFCTEIGLRISEVCSIKVADVDINARTVRLARAKKGSQVLDEVKITDHLADELRDYLLKLPQEQA